MILETGLAGFAAVSGLFKNIQMQGACERETATYIKIREDLE
jgi:hypothetical protein